MFVLEYRYKAEVKCIAVQNFPNEIESSSNLEFKKIKRTNKMRLAHFNVISSFPSFLFFFNF